MREEGERCGDESSEVSRTLLASALVGNAFGKLVLVTGANEAGKRHLFLVFFRKCWFSQYISENLNT